MKVFAFDWREHRATWQRQGWLHLRPGVTPAMLDHLEAVAAAALDDRPLDGPGLAGAKDQFLFELPPDLDLDHELFDVLAPLTGLDRTGMTLSERHVKAYLSTADPAPTAHKDRIASTVAVGVTIRVRPGSQVVLYPDDEQDENPMLGPGYSASLPPSRHPDRALDGAREVVIEDQPGDVIMFPGASTWHLRRHSAGTVILYLKFNDFHCDPLGEDPRTEERRCRTLRVLAEGDGDLQRATAVLARRFESLRQDHDRHSFAPRWVAAVWGQTPLQLDDVEIEVIRAARRGAPVADLIERAGLDRVTRLASAEVIDLLV